MAFPEDYLHAAINQDCFSEEKKIELAQYQISMGKISEELEKYTNIR